MPLVDFRSKVLGQIKSDTFKVLVKWDGGWGNTWGNKLAAAPSRRHLDSPRPLYRAYSIKYGHVYVDRCGGRSYVCFISQTSHSQRLHGGVHVDSDSARRGDRQVDRDHLQHGRRTLARLRRAGDEGWKRDGSPRHRRSERVLQSQAI